MTLWHQKFRLAFDRRHNNDGHQNVTFEDWNTPTLQNSWVNFGGDHEEAGYRKEAGGTVRLRGLIKNGTTTSNTLIFTLPSGYRPAATVNFPAVEGGNDIARVYIESDGAVRLIGVADNTFLTLDGIAFHADG